MNFKKILDEMTIIGLGSGVTLAGVSGAAVGVIGLVDGKHIRGSAIFLVGGVLASKVGYEIAAGGIGRLKK